MAEAEIPFRRALPAKAARKPARSRRKFPRRAGSCATGSVAPRGGVWVGGAGAPARCASLREDGAHQGIVSEGPGRDPPAAAPRLTRSCPPLNLSLSPSAAWSCRAPCKRWVPPPPEGKARPPAPRSLRRPRRCCEDPRGGGGREPSSQGNCAPPPGGESGIRASSRPHLEVGKPPVEARAGKRRWNG